MSQERGEGPPGWGHPGSGVSRPSVSSGISAREGAKSTHGQARAVGRVRECC